MNAAHFHVLINHIPGIGFLLGLGVLLAGVYLHQNIVRQTGLLLLFLTSLTSIPAFYSGHEAEEIAQKFGAKQAIEEHEAAAEWAYHLTLAAGAAAGLAFIAGYKQLKWGRYATTGTIVLAAFSSAALVRTGYLGGNIRHTEFSDAPQPPAGYAEPMVPHTHQH